MSSFRGTCASFAALLDILVSGQSVKCQELPPPLSICDVCPCLLCPFDDSLLTAFNGFLRPVFHLRNLLNDSQILRLSIHVLFCSEALPLSLAIQRLRQQ